MITVYSTPWCGFCKAAKQYLNEKGVTYKEVNIEEHPDIAKQLVEETGETGVPMIRIGSELVIGFDRAQIDSALTKHDS